MASTRLMKVEIAGVNVTSYVLDWEISQNFGDPIDALELNISRTVDAVVAVDASLLIEVWAGYTTATDAKIFSGYIEKFEPENAKARIRAFSKLYASVRSTIQYQLYDKSVVGNPVYPDGKYSDAFEDLVTTHCGLTADSTTVQDSGTAKIISKMFCYLTDPKERMDKIATALQWVYYYNPNTDKVYFEPKQTVTSATILTVASNVLNVPKWKYDKTSLINDLTVKGATQETEVRQVFNGDGSTQSFTLTYAPLGDVSLFYNAAKNYNTTAEVSNEAKVIGVSGITTSSFDFTVDKATKKISTVGGNGGGFTPASATGDLLAIYTAIVEIPVQKVDDVSVAENLSHEKTLILKDVITYDDVVSRAAEIVEKFKNPFVSTALNVQWDSSHSFSLGNSIRVVDSVNTPTVDDFFTIWGITLRWPDGFDEVMVGDREFNPPEFFLNMSEMINALEKEVYDENAIFSLLRSASYDIEMLPYSSTVLEEYINDSFVLDHSVNGVLYSTGETAVLDDFESSAGFSAGSGSVSLTITNNSTASQFWIGSQGVKAAWAVGSGTGVLEKAITSVDLQNVVGVTSGTPLQGTFGVWVFTATPSCLTDLKLRIGSSSTDYKEYSGQQYAWKVAGVASSFAVDSSLLTLVLFDADTVSATSGSIDWTAVDFMQLRWTIASAGNLTFDYLTGSKNNTISLNGLGSRMTQKSSTTTLY